jgi:hypothetical protein
VSNVVVMANVHVIDLGVYMSELQGWWVASEPVWARDAEDADDPVAWRMRLHHGDDVRSRVQVRNEGMAHASGVLRMVRLALGEEVADRMLDRMVAGETQGWSAALIDEEGEAT